MSPWRFSLREVARRPSRSLLTLFSIVLGVAAVFAVHVTMGSARSAFTQMNEALTGKADVAVTARGGGRFPEDVLATVKKTPGVAIAVPSVRQILMLYAPPKVPKTQILGIGVDLDQEKAVQDLRLVAGRTPRPGKTPIEVVLEENLAHFTGVGVGDKANILSRQLRQPVVVVGLLKALAPAAVPQGSVVLFHPEDLQWLSKAEGQIDIIQIVLAPGADKEKTLVELARRLPPEVEARPAWEKQAISGTATEEAFDQGLFFAGLVSLLGAATLILNTFLMNVAERRGQIAVLRLIGAQRRQVLWLLLREAVVMGLAGAVLGLPAGWGLARLLGWTMERGFGVTVQETTVSLESALLAFALGPVIAVAAAFFPARSATRVSPLEALRRRSVPPAQNRGRGKFWVGPVLAVLALSGWGLVRAGLLHRSVTVPATVVLVTGLALSFGLIQEWAIRGTSRLLGFLGPTEIALAGRQLNRNPARTFLTWSILFVAVTTSVSIASALTAVVDDVRNHVHLSVGADFFVRASTPSPVSGEVPSLPDAFVQEVAKLPGIQEFQKLSFVGMESPETGSRVLAVVRSYDRLDQLFMDLEQGRPEEVQRGLAEGEGGIVLSKTLAFQLNKGIGDTFTVDYAGRTHTFRIVGTAGLYFLGGSAFYIDRRVAERVFGPVAVGVILVTAAPGRRAEVDQALRRLCEKEGFVFQTLAEFEAFVEGILDAVLAGLWALMAVAFVIAVFSVTNTLLVNVLEQTHEIGLVRVIGMTRGQVRKMFLAQSALVGLLGVVPGCAVGMFLAYMVRSSTLAVVAGAPPIGGGLSLVAPYGVAVLLLVLIFTWLPAARAARLPILDCIRTE